MVLPFVCLVTIGHEAADNNLAKQTGTQMNLTKEDTLRLFDVYI